MTGLVLATTFEVALLSGIGSILGDTLPEYSSPVFADDSFRHSDNNSNSSNIVMPRDVCNPPGHFGSDLSISANVTIREHGSTWSPSAQQRDDRVHYMISHTIAIDDEQAVAEMI
mmetsp:Transcript_44120/g.101878  ORF Transcript_44120/g.101878 Transcript_44120/m.101878 type:complete len:115 (-) Transcript_44120:1345-1689(-)